MRPDVTKRRGLVGFTLIEILVVVTIVGITAAIIVPQIGSRDDLKAASAARVVMADLMFAQNRAIATQAVRFVRFDPANNRYEVLDSLSPLVYAKNPVTKADWIVTFGSASSGGLSDSKLDSASFDSSQIIAFDSLGAPYSVTADNATVALLSAGTIVVNSGSGTHPLTVSVEPDTGEISVQ